MVTIKMAVKNKIPEILHKRFITPPFFPSNLIENSPFTLPFPVFGGEESSLNFHGSSGFTLAGHEKYGENRPQIPAIPALQTGGGGIFIVRGYPA
jgi:hypothetical protein